MKKTLKITGMMCDHCRMHAEKALLAVDGVTEVKVTLADGLAEVTLAKDVTDDTLVAAVVAAGYSAEMK